MNRRGEERLEEEEIREGEGESDDACDPCISLANGN
jgi:hypothetical protein